MGLRCVSVWWWFALIDRSDISQSDIDAFVVRLNEESDAGSGWCDLGLRFRGWARTKGFKV